MGPVPLMFSLPLSSSFLHHTTKHVYFTTTTTTSKMCIRACRSSNQPISSLLHQCSFYSCWILTSPSQIGFFSVLFKFMAFYFWVCKIVCCCGGASQASLTCILYTYYLHGNKCNGRGRDLQYVFFYPYYHFHAPCCRFALNLFFCPSLPHLCVFLIRFCSSLLHGMEVKRG